MMQVPQGEACATLIFIKLLSGFGMLSKQIARLKFSAISLPELDQFPAPKMIRETQWSSAQRREASA